MEKYKYYGVLPDNYLGDSMFGIMIWKNSGTLLEVCQDAAREVIEEKTDFIYSYAWDLEEDIDKYLKQCRKGEANLKDALKSAMFTYLTEVVLYNNMLIFLENYVATHLMDRGLTPYEVDEIRSSLLRFVWYEKWDTKLEVINSNIDKYLKTGKLP